MRPRQHSLVVNGEAHVSPDDASLTLLHFLREQSFKAQANRWNGDRLADALDMLLEAEALSRTTAVPAEAVCGRTLMNIAALAKAR